MKTKLFICILFCSIVFSSCKDEFSPYTDVSNNYSVFCILDNLSEYQFVALQKFNHLDGNTQMPEDTKVSLSESDGDVYYFRKADYKDPYFSYYYLPDVKLKRNATYRLSVLTDNYDCQYGEATVGGEQKFKAYNSVFSGSNIYVIKYDKIKTGYYRFSIYFDYEKKINGVKQLFTQKVPYSTSPNICYSKWYSYSEQPKEGWFTSSNNSNNLILTTSCFLEAVKQIEKIPNDTAKPVFKRAYAKFEVISENLYNKYFYNYTDFDEEKYSIRQDEPVYTFNIEKKDNSGYGFIDCITKDTASFRVANIDVRGLGFLDGQ